MMPALLVLWVLGVDAGPQNAAPVRHDAGVAADRSTDDELAENLELLELFDTAEDFELLRELSLER